MLCKIQPWEKKDPIHFASTYIICHYLLASCIHFKRGGEVNYFLCTLCCQFFIVPSAFSIVYACDETPLFMNQCDCLSVKMYIFTFQSSSKNVRTTVPMKDDVTTTIKLKEQTTCLQRQ